MSSYGEHLKGLFARRLNRMPTKSLTLGNTQSVSTQDLVQSSPNSRFDELQHDIDSNIRNMWRREKNEITQQKYQALSILSREYDFVMKKILNDPLETLTQSDEEVLESVLSLDGTRPSLLVRDGQVRPDDPLAGEFADDLDRAKHTIRRISAATGRLQPSPGGGPASFFGTGVLVHASGMVLTNLHVANKLLRKNTTIFETRADHHRVLAGVEIDFSGESQSLERRCFEVVEIRPLDTTRRGFDVFDVAVLRLGEPIDQSDVMPTPLKISPDLDAEMGALGATCAVGFPGRPPEFSGERAVLIEKAIEEIFSNRFGLKRLAPGGVNKAVGTVPGDGKEWIFGHDMSTLGGSSGSPVCDLSPNTNCFGLHFSGERKDVSGSNLGHGFASEPARNALLSLGVELT